MPGKGYKRCYESLKQVWGLSGQLAFEANRLSLLAVDALKVAEDALANEAIGAARMWTLVARDLSEAAARASREIIELNEDSDLESIYCVLIELSTFKPHLYTDERADGLAYIAQRQWCEAGGVRERLLEVCA